MISPIGPAAGDQDPVVGPDAGQLHGMEGDGGGLGQGRAPQAQRVGDDQGAGRGHGM